MEGPHAKLEAWPPPRSSRRHRREASEAPQSTTARLRVKVLARLAVELYYTDQVQRRAPPRQEAVEPAPAPGGPPPPLLAPYRPVPAGLGPGAPGQRPAPPEGGVRPGGGDGGPG